MTAYVVATLALAPFALLGLYLVKCLLGIDVYPDSHLTDWLL